ncbi:hypothetical protein [Streptomyces sp. NPDC059802]
MSSLPYCLADGADRGRSGQENEGFRKARLIVLPIVAVLLIVLFVRLQSC